MGFQFAGIHVRPVTFDHLALLVHDELGEVPFYEASKSSTLLLLQVFPKGMRVVSVHVDLFEQVKLDLQKKRDFTGKYTVLWARPQIPISFTVLKMSEYLLSVGETANLLAVTWLLPIKLIAGESQNSQACGHRGIILVIDG